MKYWCILYSIFFIGCGDSDGGESPTLETRNVIIDLSSYEAGDQFVLSPYILGDTATINGKEAEAAGTFSVFSEGGASLSLLQKSQTHLTNTKLISNHELRTLINRFDPRDPISTFRTFEYLDRGVNELQIQQVWKLWQGFQTWMDHFPSQARQTDAQLTQTTACPNSLYLLGKTEAIDTSGLTKRDSEDYCILYLGNTGVSEPDPTSVETSVQKALATYKVIFDSDFSTAVSGYTFKPLVVVLPFDNTEFWPAEFSNISGAFSSSLSAQNLLPTIYVASDQKVSNPDTSDERAEFHSTIAHEMFHAAFHYTRAWLQNEGEGDADTVSIDEGLAHLFEDALGYGPLNFDGFAGAFLLEYPTLADPESTPIAVLDESQATLDDTSRGAAHTLFYYLISQKGGFSFTDGSISGGDGLTFLQTFFAGTGGVAGLAQAYGSSWAAALEGYLAALSVNNSDFMTAVHDVQDLTTNADLLGNGNLFGMKFTNFGDISELADRVGDDSVYTALTPDELTDVSLHYYQVAPYLVTITAEGGDLSVIFGEAYTNAGASLVRVK